MSTFSPRPEVQKPAAPSLRGLEHARNRSFAPRVVVVAAHPDDETIGCGGLLGRMGDAWIVLVTDGAPRDPRFFCRAGFESGDDYARARRHELWAALALAGIERERVFALGAVDQEVVHALPSLATTLTARIAALAPAIVITHAYEGGHPDHDATSLLVRAALARWPGRPTLLEMAGYHAREDGALVTGRFLEDATAPSQELELSDEEQRRKRAMLDAYVSQAEVLADFRDVRCELLRAAPSIDVRAPPFAAAWYDGLGFALRHAEWRKVALAGLDSLGLGADGCAA